MYYGKISNKALHNGAVGIPYSEFGIPANATVKSVAITPAYEGNNAYSVYTIYTAQPMAATSVINIYARITLSTTVTIIEPTSVNFYYLIVLE